MMRDIKFKKIVLTNFRGQSREVAFKDGLTQILGSNGTGKTSVYVGAKWCLTGVDELNRTNYDLFDHKLDFTPENAIPAVVEITVDADGAEYVFKRYAKQKWTRPRGNSEYVKDKSDEYKFYVDGLELTATAYKDRVVETFGMDVEKLKLCMDVRYYQMLDWKELRKHFADIVGEVKDADMRGDYTDIRPYLDKYKSEKAKEYVRQQIAPLKQQVKEIDADIKATERQLPDIEPVAAAERQITADKTRIAQINKEILGLEEANKPFIEKRNAEIAEIEALKKEYREKETDYALLQSRIIGEIENELSNAKMHNAEIDNQTKRNEQTLANRKSEIRFCKEDIDDLGQELVRLRTQNKELKSREFSDTVCPHCGQNLPADMVAELRTKFYADIDKQRAPIVERGKKLSQRLEMQKARLIKLESEEIVITDNSAARIDIDEIQNRIAQAKANIVPFADTAEARMVAEKINEANEKLTVIPEVNSAELQEESRQLVAEIELLSKIAARRESYAQGLKDIEAYQSQKSEVGVKLAKWEGLLDKLIAREREWADIVRARANEYLEYSHVEMVEINKSGELVDTCTLSIGNVDRGVTNHANKTIIGVDISNAICKRYGVNIPLFIDDFEHFTEELSYAGERQVVTFSADKHYRKLTIL